MTQKPFIVIPCYREDPAVVRHTVEGIVGGPWQIVLVDDGSPEKLVLDCPELSQIVTILRHPVNRGQGAALQTGADYAIRHGADAVVHFDADGQHDPQDIPRFLAALDAGDCDIVLGSRFLRPEDLAAIPMGRRRLLRLARFVEGCLTGLKLTDVHNGFRALGPRALAEIRICEDRMAHASEILMQVSKKHLRWKELPTHVVYSDYSSSKGQGAGNAFNILWDLITGKFSKR